MIYVVDAIMGSGKTSAAINYMNSHPEQKFLYIAPYNEETKRIQTGCPRLKFACPSDRVKQSGFTKSGDLLRLLSDKRNIAMTHELYSRASDDVTTMIENSDYTIIIDEVVDVFKKVQEDSGDVDFLAQTGALVPDEPQPDERYVYYRRGNVEYNGSAHKHVLELAERSRLIGKAEATMKSRYFYWMLPPSLFTASRNVYIMTYLFEGSTMYAFLQINNMPYQKMGVEKTESGYVFSDKQTMPDMTCHIRDYIKVLDHTKLNAIGDYEYALSKSWYMKNSRRSVCVLEDGEEYGDDAMLEEAVNVSVVRRDGIDQLRRHMVNYYRHLADDPSKFLWCTFTQFKNDVSGPGFKQSYVSWNLRATNKYSEKTTLAFLVNVYNDGTLIPFFAAHHVDIDYDKYALSALVQWIWRSAIRRGERVQLYLPSSRMRKLLNAWMDDLESGGDGSGFVDRLA